MLHRFQDITTFTVYVTVCDLDLRLVLQFWCRGIINWRIEDDKSSNALESSKVV